MKNRVLIVDDSLTVRMDLQEAFESIGLAVTTTETLGSSAKNTRREPVFADHFGCPVARWRRS